MHKIPRPIPARLAVFAAALLASALHAAPSPAASPQPAATPIPLAEVASAAEADSQRAEQIQAEAAASPTSAEIGSELDALTREIDTRLADTDAALQRGAQLDVLREFEERWHAVAGELATWAGSLTARAAQAGAELAELQNRQAAWKETLALGNSSSAPPAVIQGINAALKRIGATEAKLGKTRADILTLLSRVAAQTERVTAEVRAVQAEESAAVSGLWVQDSPPIWNASADERRDLLRASHASLAGQVARVRAYMGSAWTKMIYFLLILAGSAYALLRALAAMEKRTAGWSEEDPALARANRMLNRPIATGSVLAFLFCPVLFGDAPRLFWILCAAVALAPIMILLRRLVDRHLFPVLNAVVAFYIADQVRALVSGMPVWSRVILLLEAAGGIAFCLWLIRSMRSASLGAVARKTALAAARAGLVLWGIVLITDSLGYAGLAGYIGTGTLAGAYRAIVLYAAANVAKGLIFFALQLWPLASFTVIQRHRPLLRRRIGRLLSICASILWVLSTLNALSLRRPVLGWIEAVLDATKSVGSIELSLGGVLAFALTVWLAVLLSRFVRFVLEEDVYDRLHLAPGSSYALSTILHYLILLGGFLIALGALGVDMTKLTILAGAFGVGIGFGLQTIFNNFFSGIILLLERPIHVGDVIDASGSSGVVMQIGIRASKIRQADNAVVIVPNSLLISGAVTNRDAPGRQAQISFPVRTGYDSDPQRVIDLLTAVAAAHPLVSKNPPPDIFMKEFAQSALLFDFTCFIEDPARALRVQSDLAAASAGALRKAGITVPSP